MRIDVRSLDAILIDLIDCALLGADFYLTRDNVSTRIKVIYPPSTMHSFGTWHVVAQWPSAMMDRGSYKLDTPINFAAAEEIIRSVYKLHGGKI